MNKDAYYFSHDSNARNDQRLLKIRMKYGMEGYGIYFGIIEILREQKDYTLAFDDLQGIAFDLRIDLEKVEDVVSNYNLFVIEGMSMFYSRSLKQRMECMDEKKQKRINAGRKGGLASAKVKQKSTIAKALNKTKLNKTKVNNIDNRYDVFNNQSKEFISSYGEDTINDFVRYWTEPNKSNTKMKFEMQQTFDIKRRLVTWSKNDFGTNKNNGISRYKKDAMVKFWIGYCSKCKESDFYDDYGIKQDSRCCQSKMMPEKPKVVAA